MVATPPTIIIAHAAFHQPAHYINFTAALDEVGLTEYRIPQLPSSSLAPPAKEAFAQDVAVLRKTIRSCLTSGRDVLLLAHSYGGIPLSDALADIPQSTERDHAKVLGVVFVAAIVPEEGESLAKAMKTGVAEWVRTEGSVCKVDDPASVLFNTLGDEAALTEAVEHIRPQALSSFTAPAKTASWRYYPCAYVKCKKDSSTSTIDQEHMIEKLQRRCEWTPTVAELESDHCPFISMPEELAGLVVKLVEDAE
ncbi:hypothetical protein LTR56_026573 [Elasticomyces elasticus]|nr:hypothetical protein LTR56_026573 [Elasticomyces elasticus]